MLTWRTWQIWQIWQIWQEFVRFAKLLESDELTTGCCEVHI